MKLRLIAAMIASPALLIGCTNQPTMQQLNAEQADQLNAVAENTAEDAGNASAEVSAQAGDVGDTYRAGAAAPPRKYR